MRNERIDELAKKNEALRSDYLTYLRRLKSQAAATIAELESTGPETPYESGGIVLFKAETNLEIIKSFQEIIRELDDIFAAKARGEAD